LSSSQTFALAVTATPRSKPNIRTVFPNPLEAPYAASTSTMSPGIFVLDGPREEIERELRLRLEHEVVGDSRLLTSDTSDTSVLFPSVPVY
jgi:hypothetical protein